MMTNSYYKQLVATVGETAAREHMRSLRARGTTSGYFSNPANARAAQKKAVASRLRKKNEAENPDSSADA